MATVGGHGRGISALASSVPDQLTSQKLEENPVLPLDNQKNLVYVLTRIFRLLAQIVNPLVAWASTWKFVMASGDAWGAGLTVTAKPPETGPNAGFVLASAAPTGASVIAGHRPYGVPMWQIGMPNSTTQGDFSIERYNPAGTWAAIALSINRTNGNASFEGTVAAPRGFDCTATAGGQASLFLNSGSGNTNNYVYGYHAGSPRWIQTIGNGIAEGAGNTGCNFVIDRYANDGAWLGTAMTIHRSTGAINFHAQPKFAATNNFGVSPGTVALFNLVAINDGSCYNPANGRFTAPVAGIYYFDWYHLTPNTVGEYRIGLNINGILLRVSILNKLAATFDTVQISQSIYLAAGDYVTCTLITAPAGLYSDALYNTFSGWLVG